MWRLSELYVRTLHTVGVSESESSELQKSLEEERSLFEKLEKCYREGLGPGDAEVGKMELKLSCLCDDITSKICAAMKEL